MRRQSFAHRRTLQAFIAWERGFTPKRKMTCHWRRRLEHALTPAQARLVFDDNSTLRQCRYNGLLESAPVRMQDFGHRRALQAFTAWYAPKEDDVLPSSTGRHALASSQASLVIDDNSMLRQCRCGGLLETTQVLCSDL